jgi:prepilin-type processing-associated H-X9-DG protein/prepilin-type N-terminal cleavage/methylation domain-containing protein
MSQRRAIQEGFALTELLAVIVIIGVLGSLFFPALSRAKGKVQKMQCQSNLRQLTLCTHLYAGDNDDLLPPNSSVVTPDGTPDGHNIAAGDSWCPDRPQTDSTPANIQRGALFTYNRSVAIYHCPADTATVQTTNGQPLPQLRQRSYNMSQSVNGNFSYLENFLETANLPAFTRLAHIQAPGPSQLFVFVDELAETQFDASFGMPPRDSPTHQQWQNCWFDMPATRHSQGANLSFADGHVEHWRWRVPKVFTGFGQAVTPEEMPDYVRVQNAMKQPF